MPRRPRLELAGATFHVLNRSVGRFTIFTSDSDYRAFVALLSEALQVVPLPLYCYCIMPNHWHLVLRCPRMADLSQFMHWLTGTHALRWHGAHGTRGSGPLYQGRYTALLVQTETYFVRLCRYVERNPLRAGLVEAAEDWRWSSLGGGGDICPAVPLSVWPILQPANWREFVNQPESEPELVALRNLVRRKHPMGEPSWQVTVATRMGLSLRPHGRPRKDPRPLI